MTPRIHHCKDDSRPIGGRTQMRTLAWVIWMALPLSGCGLLERFDAVDKRINAAIPPDSGVQAARSRLLAQVADEQDTQKALEPMWASRLRLRALSCSKDYTPTWRDSSSDIRARLGNSACLAEADRSLQRWLGLQRLRLFLAKGPIQAGPPSLPAMITYRDFISRMVPAREAPVAILQSRSGFDVVSLGNGKSIFKEDAPQGAPLMDMSPNGRLFTQTTANGVVVRATEGGETVAEFPQAEGLVWLDSNVVGLRSSNSMELRLLDLAVGEDATVPTPGSRHTYLAIPVAGGTNRFNLLMLNGVVQIEIERGAGRPEVRVRSEKRTSASSSFWGDPGSMSADRKLWIDGHQGLRVLNIETLEVDEVSFKPVGTQRAWPTSNPEEFVVAMHLPSGDGITSRFNYYVYNHRANTLALIKREALPGDRYQYIASIKRLTLIDNRTVRYIDRLPADDAQPSSSVVQAFIEEMNQRRLAAATAQASMPLGPSGMGTANPVARSPSGEQTPLHVQLREAQIEGIGVYQGAGGSRGAAQARTSGVVEVRVRRSPKPVALVLSSYEPVRWMIITESGARLAAVLVSGYGASTVVGAGSARVDQLGRSYAYERGSRGYAELQQTVVSWAGKPMTYFQGRYEGSSFAVGGGY